MKSKIVIEDMGTAVSISTLCASQMEAINLLLNAINSITRDADLPASHVAAMLRGCAFMLEM